MKLLKGHHCWALRAFASAFAHCRACRRSHEYSGDPFDPRGLLTVALYDNCSSQIALASACQRAALWDLANCETWYSKTRGRVGSIFRPATPHPKESWRRRGAVQLASRTAHTRRQRNSTIAECGTVSAYQLHPSAAQITTCKTSSAAPARKFAAATASLRHHARAAPTRAVQRQRTPVDV